MKNQINLALKFSRLSRGITGCKLAERIGITSVYMSNIEQGKIPSRKIQRRIAQALNVPRQSLFNGYSG